MSDIRPRFNLSPVPSLGDNDDEEIDAMVSDSPNADPILTEDEIGLVEDAHAGTTTVTMFDKNENISPVIGNDQRGSPGKVKITDIVLDSMKCIDECQ